jgi:hypothetical protein
MKQNEVTSMIEEKMVEEQGKEKDSICYLRWLMQRVVFWQIPAMWVFTQMGLEGGHFRYQGWRGQEDRWLSTLAGVGHDKELTEEAKAREVVGGQKGESP